MFFEDGDEHLEAIEVESCGGAFWVAEVRRGN